jgi:DNA processing protein
MTSEAVALLQLMQTKGVGPRSVARVLDVLKQDELSLTEFVAMEPADIVVRFGLKKDQASSIRDNEEPAARMAGLLEEHNIRTVLRGSSLYPAKLSAVLGDKAPPVLFMAGTPAQLDRRGVGFCGARDASDEALRCTEKLARALANKGLLVVSGHAQGVDETSHRAALEAGGHTALVLPEGILHFRPRASLADSLTEDHFVVVSEFPPKLPWSVANAMQRNRTICGLVHALIVIEAGTSGGTWEAGQAALELGVPLFVMDFPNPAPSGEGNPLLLRKGGQPLPCQPGESPDISLLVKALDMAASNPSSKQPSLFDYHPE